MALSYYVIGEKESIRVQKLNADHSNIVSVTARVTALEAGGGGGGGGVTTFNTRSGVVTLTSGDVTTALAYTPLRPSNNLSDVSSASTSRTNLGITGGFTAIAADRTALAALSTAHVGVYLKEAGREGVFVWDSSNLSAKVTADTAQGVYVPPASDTTGASGAWVRKYFGPVTIKWFGAAGDKVTDDYAAFAAAVAFLGNDGGTIFIPDATYRLSQRLAIHTGVHLIGEHWGKNPGVILGTLYNFPDNYLGSALYFDNGVAGLIFYSITDTSDPSTVVASLAAGNGSPDWKFAGGNQSKLMNLAILSAGGGTLATHGVETRAQVEFENLHVRNFGGNGFELSASADATMGGGDDYGNADGMTLRNCHSWANRGDGFHAIGRDVNAVKFDSCDAILNTGWAFNDEGFLGNCYINCHAASNTAGSYRGTNVNAAHTYFGCYNEGGSQTDFATAYTIIGGNLADNGNHPASSPAFVMSGGIARRAQYEHVNTRGTSTVSATLGYNTTGMAVQTFGQDVGQGRREWKFLYRPFLGGDNSWGLQWGGSLDCTPYTIPDGNNRTGRSFAMEFPRGICIGNQTQAVPDKVIISGTAAPGAGTWKKGDVVLHSNPSTGDAFGWRCTTAGTPGTWEAMFTATAVLAAIATSGSASDLSTGTLPAGRMPAHTGDVTSSSGSVVLTIANSAVTLAKMADVATATVFYRKTAATGAPEVQTLATLKTDLGLTGTNSGDQTITLTGDVTGSGTASFATAIGANKVTLAQMAQMATASFLGRTTAATGNVEVLTATQATAMLDVFVGDAGSGGTKGLVKAPATGDSAKFLKGDGTWATPTATATAGGSDKQIQYNNATALGGAAHADIDAQGDIRLDDSSSPATPGADQLGLTPMRIAASGGRVWPRVRGEDGTYTTLASHPGRNAIVTAQATGGNSTTAIAPVGAVALTAVGTATARTQATTNRLTRAKRLGYVSAATAGSAAGLSNQAGGTPYLYGGGQSGGGWLAVFRFGVSDASLVAGAHAMIGVRGSSAAPAVATNPNTLTNVILCAQTNGSTNWMICYGGSAAQTPIDSGIAITNTSLLEFTLYWRGDSANQVAYRLEDLSTGSVASGVLTGTAGTALPLNTTILGTLIWRSNNATAAAVGIDIAGYYTESEI